MPTVTDVFYNVLRKYFANGFRLNDTIEMIRFRTFACEETGLTIKPEITDTILTKYISKCGTVFSGKVYPVSHETKNQLKDIIEQYFAAGAQVIFYEEFYEKNRKFLFGGNIVSQEMLKELIETFFQSLVYTATYCGHIQGNIPVVIEQELVRVWGDNISMNYNQVADSLTYIPLYRIQNALVQSDKFISST